MSINTTTRPTNSKITKGCPVGNQPGKGGFWPEWSCPHILATGRQAFHDRTYSQPSDTCSICGH